MSTAKYDPIAWRRMGGEFAHPRSWWWRHFPWWPWVSRRWAEDAIAAVSTVAEIERERLEADRERARLRAMDEIAFAVHDVVRAIRYSRTHLETTETAMETEWWLKWLDEHDPWRKRGG